jgi:hypothetical protein
MTEIVKVQLPLATFNTTSGEGRALIYDKDKKHVITRPLLAYERKAMGDSLKAFFKGEWSSTVGWGLTDRVPDEDW